MKELAVLRTARTDSLGAEAHAAGEFQRQAVVTRHGTGELLDLGVGPDPDDCLPTDGEGFAPDLGQKAEVNFRLFGAAGQEKHAYRDSVFPDYHVADGVILLDPEVFPRRRRVVDHSIPARRVEENLSD